MIVGSITTCIKNPEVKVIYEYAIVLPKILKFLGDRLELLSSCIAHLGCGKKTLVVSEYTVGPHRSKVQIVGDCQWKLGYGNKIYDAIMKSNGKLFFITLVSILKMWSHEP